MSQTTLLVSVAIAYLVIGVATAVLALPLIWRLVYRAYPKSDRQFREAQQRAWLIVTLWPVHWALYSMNWLIAARDPLRVERKRRLRDGDVRALRTEQEDL